jgi:hypothetical protein
MQHDALKQYYEISNFRLGGRYDLSNPASWEFGGEGGKTLESLGGKLRTAYLARISHTTLAQFPDFVVPVGDFSGLRALAWRRLPQSSWTSSW